MGSPIFRVIVDYEYRNKGSVRPYKQSKIDTFVLTNDIEKIKKDENLIKRIHTAKKATKKELEIKFKKIYIEGQYGETTY